ncbi:MAG: hypothetical protein FWC40_04620 [Proteobacteria bacterium]|nr:hypothetical protein [Pseudomonadota bacterium]
MSTRKKARLHFAVIQRQAAFFVLLVSVLILSLLEGIALLEERRSLSIDPEGETEAPRYTRRQSQRVDWLSGQAQRFSQDLRKNDIQGAQIYHRVKSASSAEEKARRRHTRVSGLNDLYGMRVVVSNELDVYRSLQCLSSTYTIVPGTLKNYIENPKPSGYRGIHAVTLFEGQRVEVQFRTVAMHTQAEMEHEAYKARTRTVHV